MSQALESPDRVQFSSKLSHLNTFQNQSQYQQNQQQPASSGLASLLNNYDQRNYGVSTQSLAEAIQKRFPMSNSIAQNNSQNTNNLFLSGYSNNSANVAAPIINSQQLSNNQKIRAISYNRSSFPNNVDDKNQLNRVKPFIVNAFNQSNDVNSQQIDKKPPQTQIHTNNLFQHGSSQNQNKMVGLFTQKQQQSSQHQSVPQQQKTNVAQHQHSQSKTHQYFYVQNQNQSLIQNMERYNILKHIEAVKRTINNPQLNMMKQRISKKYQTFANQNSNNIVPQNTVAQHLTDLQLQQHQSTTTMTIGKPLTKMIAGSSSSQNYRHTSQSVKQPAQNQSLAITDWVTSFGSSSSERKHHYTNNNQRSIGKLPQSGNHTHYGVGFVNNR
eukprot:403347269